MQSRSLVSKSLWNALSGFTAIACGMVCNIIIARLLGKGGMGEFAYETWLASFVGVLTSLGLMSSLSRYLPELYSRTQDSEAENLLYWITRLDMGLTAIGVGAILLCGLVFSHEGTTAAWIILSVLFIAQSLNGYINGYWTGVQDFATPAKLQFPSAALQIVGILVGAYFMGVAGALLGYMWSQIVWLPPTIRLIRRLRHHTIPGLEMRRRVWRYALNTWFAHILDAFVWSRIEVFFLAQFQGRDSIGIFIAASALTTLALQLPLTLSGAFMPHFAIQLATMDREQVRRTYQTVVRILFCFSAPCCLGAAVLARPMLEIIYGKQFVEATPTAVILLAGAAVLSLAPVPSSMLYAAEKSGFIAKASFIGALFTCVWGVTMISMFGVEAAAIGKVLIQIALIVCNQVYISRTMSISPPWSAMGGVLICAILCAAAAWGVHCVIAAKWAVLIAVPVGAIVYFLAMRVAKPLAEVDRVALGRVTSRFPAKLRDAAESLLNSLVATEKQAAPSV